MKINLTLDTSSHTFRTIFTLSLFLFAIVLLGSSAYSAWSNPPSSPPNSNVDAPVNVGSGSQTKSGPLGVNGLSNSGNSYIAGYLGIGRQYSADWRIAVDGTNGVYANAVGSYALYGNNSSGYGVIGNATTNGTGVRGMSSSGIGVYGNTVTSYAGYFVASGAGGGVYAQNGSGYYAYLGYPGSSWGVYTNGSIYAAASSYATAFYYNSDESLKENVAELDGLDIIKRLRGVSFTWKETGEDSVGLIAQEVEKVLPELVSTDSKTGLKSVQYGNLVGPLIEAVKEQQTEIDELKSELKALSEKVDALSK